MICPRCSIGEIPDAGAPCTVCGFLPGTNVVVEEPPLDEVLEGVRKVLGSRFDVQVLLKVGERSLVYLARELGHDRLVALKVIPVAGGVDGPVAQRFALQANIAVGLKHAHIVPVHDYGSSHSFVWYTMPHVQDPTLSEWLRRSGPLDPESCAMILGQVAAGLDYAHRQTVVHGNLKPRNIFVSQEKWVRVANFALLEAFRLPGGQAAAMPARPEYMAPEQFHGRGVGPSVDQYALGVIAYECLTGVLPFVGDSFEEVARLHLSEPPPPLTAHGATVPAPMTDAVLRALGKVPAERFPTVLDFASALNPAVAPRPSGPERRSGPAHPSQSQVLLVDPEAPRRRRRLGLLVAATTITVGSALFWWRWGNLPWQRPAERLTVIPATELQPSGLSPREAPPGPDRPAPVELAPFSPAPSLVEPAPRPAPPAAPAAVSTGRLWVNATPWGELYVDGVLVGNTPKADLVVSAGTHTVRVTRDGFIPFEQEIQVVAGQTIRLTTIVLAPRPQ